MCNTSFPNIIYNSVGKQNLPPHRMSLQHDDYFMMIIFKKQTVHEVFSPAPYLPTDLRGRAWPRRTLCWEIYKKHGPGVGSWVGPGKQSPLCVPPSQQVPANICSPNTCLSVSMWTASCLLKSSMSTPSPPPLRCHGSLLGQAPVHMWLTLTFSC